MRLKSFPLLITITVLLLNILPLRAQEAGIVSPKLIDFGRVRRGITARDSLGIANTGSETITLKAVNSSCGCTVMHFKQRALEPGDTAYIPFTFNTKGYTGLIRKTITVYFEKNQPKPLRFDLQANIYTDIEIEPRYIYLKEIPKDETKILTQPFRLINNLQRPLIVEKISCDNPMISISPESFSVRPGKSNSFKIDISPGKPGRHHIQVVLKSDYDERPRTIIPVYLQINDQ